MVRSRYLNIEGLSADVHSDFHLVVGSGHVGGDVHCAGGRRGRGVINVLLTILDKEASVDGS